MSSLHYFANRYRNRVSRKREFFNLYKTVFVILNMQKSHKISLFKILQLFYHIASPISSIFTCNICTKYRGLFPGYFLTAYALRAVILLAFWRSFQRVPWQTATTPFSPIAFSNCVVFDLPNGTYGAISLMGFNIVLLKNL